MKKSKAAPLTASLLARKGEARPAKTQVTIYDLTKPNSDGSPAKVESDQLNLDAVAPPAFDRPTETAVAEQDAPAAPVGEPSMAQVLSASMPKTAPVLPEPEVKLKGYGPIKIMSPDDAANETEPVADTDAETTTAQPAPSGEAVAPKPEPATAETAETKPEAPTSPVATEDKSVKADEADETEPMELTASQAVGGDKAVDSAEAKDEPPVEAKDEPAADDGKETDPYRLAPPYMPRSGMEEKARAARERRRYAVMGGAALVAAGLVVTMWFAYNVGMDQADEAGQRVIEAAAIRGERFPPVAPETSATTDETPAPTAEATVPEQKTQTTDVATAMAPTTETDDGNVKTAPAAAAPALPQAMESATEAAASKVSEPVPESAPVEPPAPQPAAVEVTGTDGDTGAQSVTVKVPLPPVQNNPPAEAKTAATAGEAAGEKATVPADQPPMAAETKMAEEKVAAVLPAAPVAPVKPKAIAPTPPVPTKSLAAAKMEPAGQASGDNAISRKTAALTPAAPPAGDYAIQISSVRSEATAKKEWARLQRVHGALLKNLPVHYQKADIKDKGIYYRVQVGELQKAAARKLCTQLKQRKQGCLVVKR